MCGIAGLYHREDAVDPGRLRTMSRLLRHRGPDDEGIVFVDARTGRAFTVGGPDTPADVVASDHPYAPGRWLTSKRAGAESSSGGEARFSVKESALTGERTASPGAAN